MKNSMRCIVATTILEKVLSIILSQFVLTSILETRTCLWDLIPMSANN